MNKVALLVSFLLFAFCGTGLADVITIVDGSIFEGKLARKEPSGLVVFRVADGTFGVRDDNIVSIEDREPTADERGRLLRFKTERYDVTLESGSLTPFEEEVVYETYFLVDDDWSLSPEDVTRIVAEKFNLPEVIVDYIIVKDILLSLQQEELE